MIADDWQRMLANLKKIKENSYKILSNLNNHVLKLINRLGGDIVKSIKEVEVRRSPPTTQRWPTEIRGAVETFQEVVSDVSYCMEMCNGNLVLFCESVPSRY